jgi:hypothetical protein
VTEVRSFRRVFDLERRIYRVDRLRLNPGGVPVRGVLYFLALLASALLLARVPLVAALIRVAPWYVRDALLPGAGAALLAMVRIEGRPFDLAAVALVRRALRPRRLLAAGARVPVGGLWHPPELLFLPDGSDSVMRALRFTGPGAVLIAIEHELAQPRRCGVSGLVLRGSHRAVTVRIGPGACAPAGGRVVVLAPGVRLRVRGGRPAGS